MRNLTPDVKEAGARVLHLLPRIVAARARQMGGDAIPVEISLSALAALLLELNQEMGELASLADQADPRLLVLASAIHKIADSVTPLLDALEGPATGRA